MRPAVDNKGLAPFAHNGLNAGGRSGVLPRCAHFRRGSGSGRPAASGGGYGLRRALKKASTRVTRAVIGLGKRLMGNYVGVYWG
jgi:hypothetical protein